MTDNTPGTDVAHVDPTTTQNRPGMLDKIEYAKTLAAAGLLPRAYQKQPANVLVAIELGEALGIPTIQAITGIHVIEGKPSASADLMVSLVRKAGHKVRVIVDDQAGSVTAQLIRADDPDFTYEARWDMKRAQQAGLTGKDNWKKHPLQMLRSRATAEVCRMGATDALYGVNHETSEIEVSQIPDRPSRRVTAAEIIGDQTPTPPAPAPAEDVVDVETVDAEWVDGDGVVHDQPVGDDGWPTVAPVKP